jgi:hypothetical protein
VGAEDGHADHLMEYNERTMSHMIINNGVGYLIVVSVQHTLTFIVWVLLLT